MVKETPGKDNSGRGGKPTRDKGKEKGDSTRKPQRRLGRKTKQENMKNLLHAYGVGTLARVKFIILYGRKI